MVGTKRLGGVLGWLVGSTGRQLLRNCKSPVWIHKNTTRAPIEAVLVATDFSPVADESLELGVRVAAAENATLHLLHVASLPSDSLLSWGNVAADKLDRARDHLLSDAKGELAQRFATIDRDLLSKEPRQHLLTGEPADVIADQVKQHKIDLLVMGTQTHQKEAWFTMGSTAERLLTTLDCSLLAVKPADFVSPIHQ
jgi:nucleotide-binding universal stress UspA family protein